MSIFADGPTYSVNGLPTPALTIEGVRLALSDDWPKDWPMPERFLKATELARRGLEEELREGR